MSVLIGYELNGGIVYRENPSSSVDDLLADVKQNASSTGAARLMVLTGCSPTEVGKSIVTFDLEGTKQAATTAEYAALVVDGSNITGAILYANQEWSKV